MADSLISLLVTATAVVLIAAGILTPTIDYTFRKKMSGLVALIAVVVTLILSVALLYSTFQVKGTVIYGDALKIDVYGGYLALVAVSGTLMVLAASLPEVRGWSTAPSFYSLLILTLLGVYYMVFINDIVLLFVVWTMVSVATYALVGVKKDEASLEGATKYALMGVMATSFMFYGVALLYGLTGSTGIAGVVRSMEGLKMDPILLVSIMLFIAAFGFKIGVVPFHGWLPDVYGGVHPILISYIAGVVKIVGIAAILRLIYPLSHALSEVWLMLFSVLTVATMSFGNITALIQRNVQRMMAYSSIAQVGYMLLGVTAAVGAGYLYGLQGIALHMTTYMLAKVGVFVGLSYLLRKGVRLELEGLSGLGRRMPIAATSLTILMFSLIGVPPLLGFWSKFPYLFLSTVEMAPWLTLMAIGNSALSVGYYVQVIRYMFFTESEAIGVERLRDHEIVILVIASSATIILGLGLAPYIASSLTVG